MAAGLGPPHGSPTTTPNTRPRTPSSYPSPPPPRLPLPHAPGASPRPPPRPRTSWPLTARACTPFPCPGTPWRLTPAPQADLLPSPSARLPDLPRTLPPRPFSSCGLAESRFRPGAAPCGGGRCPGTVGSRLSRGGISKGESVPSGKTPGSGSLGETSPPGTGFVTDPRALLGVWSLGWN